MRLFRRLASVSLMLILASAASVKADELPVALTIPADSSKALSTDLAEAPSSKALREDKEAVRLALCGLEADSGGADLDAGLIDFKTPDPHAAGRSYDDQQHVGQNVPDYRSSVFLGLTLGYHF